jgi:peptide-methionine (R)-S-oxide reductase
MSDKKKLSELEYQVLFHKATEPRFSHPFNMMKQDGDYVCKNCGQSLFSSKEKYDSGSGWPSFFDAYPESIYQLVDHSHGMERIEIICSQCQCHLGHVFHDGPKPTGLRFCVNGSSLDFKSV